MHSPSRWERTVRSRSRRFYKLFRLSAIVSPYPVMTSELKHLCVCICTYKRPQLLKRLLDELAQQNTEGLFTYSILVADNDSAETAKLIVEEFESSWTIPILYCVQSQQNISLTRNKAIENAEGDFIVFIDDDEFPIKDWLLILFKACNEYKVDGVLGPVLPYFDVQPPKWVIRGKFYERPIYPTGLVIDGKKGRTGNVLLKMQVFADCEQPFKPEFRTGEDQDFFGRMIEKGFVFIWCQEAVAYEVVAPIRWNRSFMLRRALLRGATSSIRSDFGPRDVLKSLMAVPAYTVALPFTLLLGQHLLMNVLIKLFDHSAKLLRLVGVNPIKEQYVTK